LPAALSSLRHGRLLIRILQRYVTRRETVSAHSRRPRPVEIVERIIYVAVLTHPAPGSRVPRTVQASRGRDGPGCRRSPSYDPWRLVHGHAARPAVRRAVTGRALDAPTRQPTARDGARPERVPIRTPLGVDLDDGHALTIARTADTWGAGRSLTRRPADRDRSPRRAAAR
jgi:hypothetical protein